MIPSERINFLLKSAEEAEQSEHAYVFKKFVEMRDALIEIEAAGRVLNNPGLKNTAYRTKTQIANIAAKALE